MKDLIVLSVTFTYIKATFSSAQGRRWGGGRGKGEGGRGE